MDPRLGLQSAQVEYLHGARATAAQRRPTFVIHQIWMSNGWAFDFIG
jgi:hypothetical protein